MIAGQERKTTHAGGIRGEKVLLWNPCRVAVGDIEAGGGFHGANPAGESIGPGYLAVEIDGADLKISPGSLCQHRPNDQRPK